MPFDYRHSKSELHHIFKQNQFVHVRSVIDIQQAWEGKESRRRAFFLIACYGAKICWFCIYLASRLRKWRPLLGLENSAGIRYNQTQLPNFFWTLCKKTLGGDRALSYGTSEQDGLTKEINNACSSHMVFYVPLSSLLLLSDRHAWRNSHCLLSLQGFTSHLAPVWGQESYLRGRVWSAQPGWRMQLS